MKVFRLICISLFLSSCCLYAQEPTDCSNAIIVCGNSDVNLDVNGIGIQELSGSNTCGSQENNSLWFQVNIKTGGKLGFVLTPTFSDGTTNTDLAIDFDFFIFDVFCINFSLL